MYLRGIQLLLQYLFVQALSLVYDISYLGALLYHIGILWENEESSYQAHRNTAEHSKTVFIYFHIGCILGRYVWMCVCTTAVVAKGAAFVRHSTPQDSRAVHFWFFPIYKSAVYTRSYVRTYVGR